MATYYIGADVHCNNTELAIEQRGKIVARYSVPTTIPAISTVLSSLQGRKILAMEEGPMAGWLYRNLNEKVEKFVVAEPRRNKLITCEGDKDDRIDSGKLAILLRGNYLNPSFPIRVENHEFKKYFGYFWPSIEVYGVEMASNRV